MEAQNEYEVLKAAIETHQPLEIVTRLYAKYVLACKSNNKVRTADQLGIDRRTLQRWSKQPLPVKP